MGRRGTGQDADDREEKPERERERARHYQEGAAQGEREQGEGVEEEGEEEEAHANTCRACLWEGKRLGRHVGRYHMWQCEVSHVAVGSACCWCGAVFTAKRTDERPIERACRG